MIRITKITEKYKDLLFETAESTEAPPAESETETPPAQGETAEVPAEETTEETTDSGEYQAGDIVVYIYSGKTMDDWNALSDEDKANLEEKPASDVVNVKKIEKIEGDKVFFKDQKGEEFTKKLSDIVQKQTPTEESSETPPEGEATETTEGEPTETTGEEQAQNVKEKFTFTENVIKFDKFFKK